ncbi:DMT family transporter [Vibrio cholerae]
MPHMMTLCLALIAFAANSFFCRLALASGAIDPGSFTLLRLFSGAVTLALLLFMRGHFQGKASLGFLRSPISWWSAIALFVYAVCFSYAYTELSTGTGALLLFGMVQMTLIVYHVVSGNALSKLEKVGILASVTGFVVLMLPSAHSPSLGAASLMLASGVAWAMFTVLGKKSGVASVAITHGFILASLLALLASPVLLMDVTLTSSGVMWALASGIAASGLGYILWYQVLKQITVLKASIAQLAVPVIAFLAGSIGLGETITFSAVLASALVLGGIAVIFVAKAE